MPSDETASSPSNSARSPPRTITSPEGDRRASSSTPKGPTTNPFSQLGVKGTAPSAPRINISGSAPTPQKREGDGTLRSRSRQGVEEPLDVWEDKQLGQIFRITLKPEAGRDSHGRELFFLSGLRSDLNDEKEPIMFKTSHLDQALTEAGTQAASGGKDPLDYLLASWKRVTRAVRATRTAEADNPRMAVLKEARRLCMSYCMFAVTMPEMFEAEQKAENVLTKHLLAEPDSDGGLDPEFLAEASSRFEEDDMVQEAFVTAIEQLSAQLSHLTMNDNYKPYMMALRTIVRYPRLANAITHSAQFLPSGIQAQDIERQTLLGPFFRISPIAPDVAQNYFSAPTTRDRGYIANAQKALRMTLSTHQGELFDVANVLIKTGKETRERVLDWFALTVNANHKRRAIRPDFRTLSSDGFMVNITAILDQLCDPFMDATFSKIDRIDVDYLRRDPRVSIQDETKINADQHKSDEFYANKAEGTNNFISEVFFLTVAAHHYGTEAANTRMEDLRKQVKYLTKDVERMEAERPKFANQPQYLRVFEIRLKKFKDELDAMHCTIHATQGVLLDEVVQARSMHFMRYIIVWLLRLASGNDFPKQKLSLPLPATPPEAFNCLPEYFVDDIVGNFGFITRHMPHIIIPTQCEELVDFCITFLRSSEYIKSPYCKSALVKILFHGVYPFPNHPKGSLGDMLNGSTFCHKHLLHALMKFYIECESTGAHTQFFDKFNIRYEIDQVIKCIWPNVIYRDNLAKEAK